MAMSLRPETYYLKYFGVRIMKNGINANGTNLGLNVKEYPFNFTTSVCFVILGPREI